MNDSQDNRSTSGVRPAERIAGDTLENAAPPAGRQQHTAPQTAAGFDFNQPTIIGLLYLASWLTGGLGGLVGIVLAYVWRSEPKEAWEPSHFTYLIRTFWIGLLLSVVSWVFVFVLIGIPMLIAVAIWSLVRTVMSLVRAQKREPMPEPYSWLI